MNIPTPGEDTMARLRATLAERAAADGLLDVAYTTVDSPLGSLTIAATRQASSGSRSTTSGRTTCSPSWP